MAKRISVVISQGQSQNPAKQALEEDLVAGLLMEPGIDVTVIPHLYDLKPDGTGMLALHGIKGPLIVISWLFERAAHWILDRNDIGGREGLSLIRHEDEDEQDDESGESKEAIKDRVIDHRDLPDRKIYCIDLRVHKTAQPYIDEVKRIAVENNTEVVQLGKWIQGDPQPEQMQRFLNPGARPAVEGNGTSNEPPIATRIQEEPSRRWYPVIDFSRCTNCMECIDFCLFGVYGVDRNETILVEQPDNCRKGCPACSRVCPENAIIFPQHKAPTIAGSSVVAEGLKIDLSKLFGAPDAGKSAVEIAALERDEQLLMAGREAVGMTVGIAKRQTGKQQEPRDELDNLIDELDELDL